MGAPQYVNTVERRRLYEQFTSEGITAIKNILEPKGGFKNKFNCGNNNGCFYQERQIYSLLRHLR